MSCLYLGPICSNFDLFYSSDIGLNHGALCNRVVLIARALQLYGFSLLLRVASIRVNKL